MSLRGTNHGQIGTGAVSFSEQAPVVIGHTFSEEMAGQEFTCAVTLVGEAVPGGFTILGNGVTHGAAT